MFIFFLAALFAGLTSLVNLYEAPVATLQDNLKFGRAKAVIVIAAVGVAVSLCIQGIVSQWMDFVSIYICPLGAGLAGIMFAWVWGRKAVEDACPRGGSIPSENGIILSTNMYSVFSPSPCLSWGRLTGDWLGAPAPSAPLFFYGF